jgi:hypothetical protein
VTITLSLRFGRQRVTERIKRPELVLAQMRRGAVLHCQHTPQGTYWALSTGHRVDSETARLVAASASVISVGDALFKNIPGHAWRYVEY